MDAFVAIQGEDDLTIATGLEVLLVCVLSSDVLMVVYFAIDCQHLRFVGREKGLLTALRIYDAETFVCQDG